MLIDLRQGYDPRFDPGKAPSTLIVAMGHGELLRRPRQLLKPFHTEGTGEGFYQLLRIQPQGEPVYSQPGEQGWEWSLHLTNAEQTSHQYAEVTLAHEHGRVWVARFLGIHRMGQVEIVLPDYNPASAETLDSSATKDRIPSVYDRIGSEDFG